MEKIKYHKSVLYCLTKIVNALPLFIDFYQYKLSTYFCLQSIHRCIQRKISCVYNDREKESSRIIRQSVLQLESSLDQCTNKLRSTLTSLQKWYILLEQEKELIITEIFKTLRDMDNVLDVFETLSIGLYFNLAEICWEHQSGHFTH